MEKFRPLISQSNNFLDPLSGGIIQGEDVITVGVDVVKHTSSSNRKSSQMSPQKIQAVNASIEKQRRLFGGGQSYIKEWEIICKCKDIKEMHNWALEGELPACRFRSICWRIFLNILPLDFSKWLSVLRDKRDSYERSRHQLMVTPGSTDPALDPNVNNPLSQNEQSPWNQYFEDSELKRLIRLDVHRTFPEVDYFQLPRIQEMMVSILFCYARKYPNICYIQGMHEILAPLTFVLNYDHHVHAHSLEEDPTPTLLHEVMDQAYLEHDSFVMFEVVMQKLYHWYEDGEPKTNPNPRTHIIQVQPFARPQDIGPTTKIVQRLTRIHDELLKKHEPEVFAHLNKLEIPPQVYGIRWARLMFGREFSLTDLLIIWDAIFADSYTDFLLIEYLMVAMLSNIRDQLLSADYITSLNLLMRYPPTFDVQSIIKMALYFRNPKNHMYPTRYTSLQPNQTVGGIPNVHRAPQTVTKSTHTSVTRSASLPRHQITNASTLKSRSTSVDQKSRSGSEGERRKTSPKIETMDPLSVVAFRTCKISPDEDEEGEELSNGPKSLDSTTTKVVSGLVRLGERLSRPREIVGTPTEPSAMERPMDDLKYVERSAPIPTNRISSIVNSHRSRNSPISSEEEGEDDPSFPQKSFPTSFPRVTAEDVLAISLGCALRLSQHQASLSTRLAQLNIESDFTIRAAMEGITEVIESLKEIQGRQNKKIQEERSLLLSRAEAAHPLMDDYDNS